MVSSPLFGPTLWGEETDPDSRTDQLTVMSSPGLPRVRDLDHALLIPLSSPLLGKRTGSQVIEQVRILCGFDLLRSVTTVLVSVK